MIHDGNTILIKDITSVKEIWKPGLNLHRFWPSYSFVFSAFKDQFKKLYQTVERAFDQISKHLGNWVKTTWLQFVFQLLLDVWRS